VELLAASAISSMLMVGLLTVMGAVSLDQGQARATATRQAPVSFEELLRNDLVQARFVSYGGDWLSLRSYSGLDWQTLGPTHRPVEITYGIVEMAGSRWLVRRQVDLDSLSSDGQRSVPVLGGVRGLRVRLLEVIPSEAPDGSLAKVAAPRRHWREMASSARWEAAPRGIEVAVDTATGCDDQRKRIVGLR